MPSEALSDGIFYCLCRFVSGWQCRRRGIVVPPFGFSDGIGGFGRHRGFGGLKPTLQYKKIPPSGTDTETMAGRNGRVGFSPPLQTASNVLSGFRRHSGFGGLKPTLPLLTNHPDKPPRQTKPPRLKHPPPPH
ncbi:hypothetical protein, partial [Neisseria polysaccharea]|uniref:hypothetical protein n=1 Tax=Neisseria polysaccharea TaxID=489 RepID=UPI0027E10197